MSLPKSTDCLGDCTSGRVARVYDGGVTLVSVEAKQGSQRGVC